MKHGKEYKEIKRVQSKYERLFREQGIERPFAYADNLSRIDRLKAEGARDLINSICNYLDGNTEEIN